MKVKLFSKNKNVHVLVNNTMVTDVYAKRVLIGYEPPLIISNACNVCLTLNTVALVYMS